MNLIFYNVVLNSMLKYVTITVKVTDRCNVYRTFSQNFNLATGNNKTVPLHVYVSRVLS